MSERNLLIEIPLLEKRSPSHLGLYFVETLNPFSKPAFGVDLPLIMEEVAMPAINTKAKTLILFFIQRTKVINYILKKLDFLFSKSKFDFLSRFTPFSTPIMVSFKIRETLLIAYSILNPFQTQGKYAACH